MYAEIKSNDKILINRLDSNEKIMLEGIYKTSNEKEITLKELYNESGDFGGVFIELKDKEKEIMDLLPSISTLYIGKTNIVEFTSEDIELLNKMKVFVSGIDTNVGAISIVGNKLEITCIDNEELIGTTVDVTYSVIADGYIPEVVSMTFNIEKDEIDI